MNRRETPPGAPHPPIRSGLAELPNQSSPGRSDPPVKPTSEVAHQPGQQQTYGAGTPDPVSEGPSRPRARLCGGVQHRETKSAGQTTGGACGGTRLGNPCDEDGLTR